VLDVELDVGIVDVVDKVVGVEDDKLDAVDGDVEAELGKSWNWGDSTSEVSSPKIS
jgi:hypothetical protein